MLKEWSFFLILLFVASQTSAQELEYYLPVGFQNPLLKSGQYALSTFYHRTDQQYDAAESIRESKSYNFTSLGYFGLTDEMTLGTTLYIFPGQTVAESRGNSLSRDRANLNFQASLALSYRPRRHVELFVTAFRMSQKTIFGDRTYFYEVPFDIDPETGAIIYVRAPIVQTAPPDLKSTSTTMKLGITLTGNLW